MTTALAPETDSPDTTDAGASATPLRLARRSARPVLMLAAGFALAQAAARVGDGTWLPAGVVFQGLVSGMLTALVAVSVVLVYRSARIINFAAGSVGAAGGVVFILIGVSTPIPWILNVPVSLAAAAVSGAMVDKVFIRRFADSPRLILTVVTLGVSTIMGTLLFILVRLIVVDRGDAIHPLRTPLRRFRFNLDPLVFTGDHVLAVAVPALLLVGLGAFLRYTNLGIGVRAMAENRDRVMLLGIDAHVLSRTVWIIASVFSAVTFILASGIAGEQGAAAGTTQVSFVGFLAAAVIARMEDLPEAAAAAVGIALVETGVTWGFTSPPYVNLAVFAAVIIALLTQRNVARRNLEGTGAWVANAEPRPIPPELAALPSVRRGVRRLSFAAVVVVAAVPWVMSPSQTRTLQLMVLYAIVGVSLVILTGWGGQVSLGQMGFAGLGAAVGIWCYAVQGWPFLLAVVAASGVGGMLALVVGFPALRVRGLFLAVATLTFSIVVSTVVLNPQLYPGKWLLADGGVTRPAIFGFSGEDERVFFYFCVLGLGVALYLARGLRRSRTGRVLIAMRDNERAAQSFSVNLVRTRLLTFVLSGCMASYAGVMLAVLRRDVAPTTFGLDSSIAVFLMAVIGGLGSLAGAVVGAIYLGLYELTADWTIFTNLGVIGALLRLAMGPGIGAVIVLLLFPGGLSAAIYGLRDAALRRVAERHRLYVPSLLADYRREDIATERHPSPKPTDEDGRPVRVPVRYRMPSSVRTLGQSQRTRTFRRSA